MTRSCPTRRSSDLARGTGRLLARLDNIEEFEDDRMRFEARFELGHHRHESVHRRRRAPRPELAPDRVAIGHEAVLVGLAYRMDEAIIRHQEAVGGGCGEPIEQ